MRTVWVHIFERIVHVGGSSIDLQHSAFFKRFIVILAILQCVETSEHFYVFRWSRGCFVRHFYSFFFFVVVSTLLFLVRVFLTLAWVRTVQQVYKFKLQLNEDSTFKQKKNLIVMSAHGIFIKCVFPFLFFVLLLFLFFRHSFCTCSL